MDAIRRGAMVALGKRAVGAIGAAGLLASGSENAAKAQAASSLKRLARGGYGEPDAPSHINADPLWEARNKAARPLRDKIDELLGYSRNAIPLISCLGFAETLPDLAALKSTSVHWRAHVAQERAKKLRTAIQSLEAEIEKIMSSPLDAVQNMLRDAANAFLSEMQRP